MKIKMLRTPGKLLAAQCGRDKSALLEGLTVDVTPEVADLLVSRNLAERIHVKEPPKPEPKPEPKPAPAEVKAIPEPSKVKGK